MHAALLSLATSLAGGWISPQAKSESAVASIGLQSVQEQVQQDKTREAEEAAAVAVRSVTSAFCERATARPYKTAKLHPLLTSLSLARS